MYILHLVVAVTVVLVIEDEGNVFIIIIIFIVYYSHVSVESIRVIHLYMDSVYIHVICVFIMIISQEYRIRD